MNKEDDILVRISGQTHRLRPDQPESLRKIPWQQRKRLIEVLEAMKKAEYVEPVKDDKAANRQQAQARPNQAMAAETMAKPNSSQKPSQQTAQSMDSDAMMQRFLAEQQTHKPSIPTKASIYKWFLIVFAIILLLVLVF